MPAMSFDLSSLRNLNLDFVWDFRITMPSDVLETAQAFTALSFAGALAKILVWLANGGMRWSLEKCLSGYETADGAEVSLGIRSRERSSYDYLFTMHPLREVEGILQENFGEQCLVLGADGTVELVIDGDPAFNAGLHAVLKLLPGLTRLSLKGCTAVSGPMPPLVFAMMLDGTAELEGCGGLTLPTSTAFDKMGEDDNDKLHTALSKVTKLDLRDETIKFTLEGKLVTGLLQALVNLEVLWLTETRIHLDVSDLQPLPWLEKLTSLSLPPKATGTLDDLSTAINLTHFNSWSVRGLGGDLSALSTMVHSKHIDLWYSKRIEGSLSSLSALLQLTVSGWVGSDTRALAYPHSSTPPPPPPTRPSSSTASRRSPAVSKTCPV